MMRLIQDRCSQEPMYPSCDLLGFPEHIGWPTMELGRHDGSIASQCRSLGLLLPLHKSLKSNQISGCIGMYTYSCR